MKNVPEDPLGEVWEVTIAGVHEERGRFPGLMKFASEGIYPKELEEPGTEKSSISLFMMTPVSGTMSLLPKRRFIVEMEEIAKPVASAVAMCDVPGLSFQVK